jgi:hypothetical protein
MGGKPSVRRRRYYPFARMQVGDSFQVGIDVEDARRVRAAARGWGNRNGAKFTVQKRRGVWHCWRVALPAVS